MRRLLRLFCWALTIKFVLLCIVGFLFLAKIGESLPSIETYTNYRPYQTSYFYDKNGVIIGCVAAPYRDVIPKEQLVGSKIAKIILAVEDERFYQRKLPIDAHSIMRAFWKNKQEGRVVQGGSTLWQQLAKQLLPPEEQAERSISRKIKEFILAFRLWRAIDKDTALWLYLNEIYLAHNRNGVEAASLFFYNKHIDNLSISEIATIAGIIHSPETLSPKKHPREALVRRNAVLEIAFLNNIISTQEYNEAITERTVTTDDFSKQCLQEPYVVDYVRTLLREKFNLTFDSDYFSPVWLGVKVFTTIDSNAQRMAREGVGSALDEYHQRLQEKAADANGAMLVLENKTGAIRALVGGKNYKENKFNNVVQAHRQPGSAIKPIVYAAYFTKELADGIPKEGILERPISNTFISCRGSTKGRRWIPHNFDEQKWRQPSYKIRDAIANSINRCALHAAALPGKPCSLDPQVILTARALHIDSPPLIEIGSGIYFRLPLAIGAVDLTPLELTRAYMVFPNRGRFLKEYIIEEVRLADGTTLHQHQQTESTDALSTDVADIMVEALRGVVLFGTAKSTLSKLEQPVAGKTGTTNHYSDAWFCGFTPDITSCVWVGGKDKSVSLGNRETGGRVAAPAFRKFVMEYYKGKEPVPFNIVTESNK